MDGEASLSQGASELITSKFSLNELLGENWKQDCVFDNLQAALPKEARDIEAARDIDPNRAETETEKFVVQANSMFEANKSPYKSTLITDESGAQSAYLTGDVEGDKVYQIVRKYMSMSDSKGSPVLAWVPDKIGFIGTSGKVFSLDGALHAAAHKEAANDLLFMEFSGRKFDANMQVKREEAHGTTTYLPENVEQLDTLFHEVGHLLRQRRFAESPNVLAASDVALKEFNQVAKTRTAYNPDANLSTYTARKIVVDEERGASAAGISLIREAGKEVGLNCASKKAIDRMLAQDEKDLSTYDRVPYSFIGHDNDKPIPAFSKFQRTAARKLSRIVKRLNLTYDAMPSFDQQTGENLASNPAKLSEQLSPV